MKDLFWYVDEAKKNLGIQSDRQLCEHLGMAGTSVNMWRKRGVLPTPEHMIALAESARVDPREALVDLAIWQADSRKEPRAAEVWQSIRQALVACVALVILAFSATGATAQTVNKSPDNSQLLNIIENFRRAFFLHLARLFRPITA